MCQIPLTKVHASKCKEHCMEPFARLGLCDRREWDSGPRQAGRVSLTILVNFREIAKECRMLSSHPVAEACGRPLLISQRRDPQDLSQSGHRFVTGGMVRPEGFEPPTNGFGSHYSIQLSYERIL